MLLRALFADGDFGREGLCAEQVFVRGERKLAPGSMSPLAQLVTAAMVVAPQNLIRERSLPIRNVSGANDIGLKGNTTMIRVAGRRCEPLSCLPAVLCFVCICRTRRTEI
jgi:hypothetical protein